GALGHVSLSPWIRHLGRRPVRSGELGIDPCAAWYLPHERCIDIRSVLLTFKRGTVGTERERGVGVSCAGPTVGCVPDRLGLIEPLDIRVERFIRQSLVGSVIHQ